MHQTFFRDVRPENRAQLTDALMDEVRALPPVETTHAHQFAQGIYARTVRLPAGTFTVSKIAKYPLFTILSAGRVTLLEGDKPVEVTAPYAFIAAPGIKRVCFVHEDAVWTAIHPTTLTDLAAIEATFIAQSDEDYEQHVADQQKPRH
jgi:hypothetical protein